MKDQWRNSREITERIVIEGDLILETPTSFGEGDTEGTTDMPLLTDPLEEKALLTGASIAGALRNYLRERTKGYANKEFFYDKNGIRDVPEGQLPTITRLFGELEDDTEQSYLIVDDSIGDAPKTELRDGVKIKADTRTAEEGAKFDLELLEAGTKFKLRFELLISDYLKDSNKQKDFDAPSREDLIAALATALEGFEKGEIHVGRRKRRGYGQCRVESWTVKSYDLKHKDGLMAWLSNDALAQTQKAGSGNIAKAIKDACGIGVTPQDKRAFFKLKAQFALDGSLLIRSGSKLPGASDKAQPDTTHLRSKRLAKASVPIVSGTSLAGVLRHRALRIARTIATDDKQGEATRLVERIFGVDMKELKKRNEEKRQKAEQSGKRFVADEPFASRLEVRETEITDGATSDLVQTRVRIDRFTGGAYEGALFDAAPVFGKDKKKAVDICLTLRQARLEKGDGELEKDDEVRERTEAEIGIVLLLLKDLWTSDLAIGGESSVGRGRLQGLNATLEYRNGTGSWHIELSSEPGKPEQVQFIKAVLPAPAHDEAATKFLNGFVEVLNSRLGNKLQGGTNK